jgi:hypothetical protein
MPDTPVMSNPLHAPDHTAILSSSEAKEGLTFSISPAFPEKRSLPACAIDLGFSHTSKSCGFAVSNQKNDAESLHFGQLTDRLGKWIEQLQGPECAVILEAPLSHAYNAPQKAGVKSNNPAPRAFERALNYRGLDPDKRCPWYTGSGASMSLAALRLLSAIKGLSVQKTVYLFEGFHPRWVIPNVRPLPNRHHDVASQLLDGYLAGRITGQPANGIRFAPNLAAMAGAQLADGHESVPPWIVFASADLFDRFKSRQETNNH